MAPSNVQPTVSDVFGVRGGSNPLSYVYRSIEHDLREALADPKYEAIIVYGTSKQGKSSLRRSVLPNNECTFISANENMTREGLYREVLNQAGAEHERTTTKKWDFKFLRWFGFGGKITVGEVPVDYSTTASVARKYQYYAGQKPIVIDNFHYISPTVQGSLATDIRVFAEVGVKVVILGTWSAQNYILDRNMDLIDRAIAFSIEPWAEVDLLAVVDKGVEILNVDFCRNVKAGFVRMSAGNISLLQNGAKQYLKHCGIETKQLRRRELCDEVGLREVYRLIASDLVADTTKRFRTITELGEHSLKGRTRLFWLITAFLSHQQIENTDGEEIGRLLERANLQLRLEGGRELELSEVVEEIGPRLLTEQQRHFKTPLIAFDASTGRLFVLDSRTLFTLRRHRLDVRRALVAS